jgi:cell division protein FtsB
MPSWMLSPIFAVFVTVISIFLLLSLLRTDVKLEETARIRDNLRASVAVLRDEVAHIEAETQIATATATQEKIIRNELLMQKPGEYIVQLPSMESINQARSQIIQDQNIKNNIATKDKSKIRILSPNKSPIQNWLIMFGLNILIVM